MKKADDNYPMTTLDEIKDVLWLYSTNKRHHCNELGAVNCNVSSWISKT
jgi:hypothetical protein